LLERAALGKTGAKIQCLTLGVGFVLKGTEQRIQPRFDPETALKKQLFFLLTNFGRNPKRIAKL
jgi:hypothetical protein